MTALQRAFVLSRTPRKMCHAGQSAVAALACVCAGPEGRGPALVASLAHTPRMAARAGGPARAVCAVCAAADSVHAQHQRSAQSQAGAARADHERRRQADWRVQAQQPPVGATGADFTISGQSAGGHGRPPLLSAPWHGFHAHTGLGGAYRHGQPAGRLHHHPATGAQPLPHRNWPCPQYQPQAQGSDHGLQDRGALYQGRDS